MLLNLQGLAYGAKRGRHFRFEKNPGRVKLALENACFDNYRNRICTALESGIALAGAGDYHPWSANALFRGI